MPETNKTSVNHKKLFSMMMFTPFDLTERNNKAFSASFSALDTIMIKAAREPLRLAPFGQQGS